MQSASKTQQKCQGIEDDYSQCVHVPFSKKKTCMFLSLKKTCMLPLSHKKRILAFEIREHNVHCAIEYLRHYIALSVPKQTEISYTMSQHIINLAIPILFSSSATESYYINIALSVPKETEIPYTKSTP